MEAFALEKEIGKWPGEALAPIKPGLELIERRIDRVIGSDVAIAVQVARHVLDAGGKRLRPAMIILSAGACGAAEPDEKVIDLAVASELVHTASLVHDDVVDETRRRRGAVTANEAWGNKLGVLSGDYLLAKAHWLLRIVNDAEVTLVLTNTAVSMAESQVLEAGSEGDLAAWQEHYWRIIEGKTAAFISACCECGAILARADESTREALRDYGVLFGKAFQITDDLLDVLGDPALTGKDRGSDLMHGKFTLPVLMAVEKLSEPARARLMARLARPVLTPEESREISDEMVACGATESAREMARGFVDEARSQLAALPRSIFADSLDALAASLVDRIS